MHFSHLTLFQWISNWNENAYEIFEMGIKPVAESVEID